ncbi:hypothetical protein CLAFUW4_11171 [Fulvia fulva]|uniref:F-box domain-containing protein n=1 Tax=Passalora fulva TaxID=5499 RepID=A0A9Q8PDH6_PASFU|nr:uncharacterized protein CLAFUR5_10214 [Fulvia fulva]KAK4619906.1 hypothetical protein CLAFUR4_11176 [Fulvia fulva]KAK4620295.1 hypothetical protein CLAFUR0_11181 [Fulvia fulva]UJO20417.1 hypothetical protein CLAFUR5_10214 [Fulvia fulva]WPV16847.1 hypothetical protein CLAFUW4_11171 [Fulvia fulva]WPV32116.1 hypothetical protein CLAFUW7_11167 [Fulvia fulva]
MTDLEKLPVTLIHLLSNSIVLRQTAPYVPVRELRRLTATSKSLRQLIYSSSDAWRYLHLSSVKRAVIDSSPIDAGGYSWRAERMDESLTEDDFYAGPLRGILNSLHSKWVLKHVQTLILDGLSVPADLVREILVEDRYRVRILSIREAKNLNQAKLQQVLRYICRPARQEGTPTLKALYVFGARDTPRAITTALETVPNARELGVMSSAGAQIGAEWNQKSSSTLASRLSDEETKWYTRTGRAIKKPWADWPDTLQACKGLIGFDAVLCRGPRHDITKVDSKAFLQPTIATVALGPSGCESCGSCPEAPAMFGDSPESALPLLGPVPLHSSTLRAAVRPDQIADGNVPKLILRCEDCLRGRWCEQCNRWWCEDCYQEPVSRTHHLRTGMQQLELRDDLQRNGWAEVNHNPGSTTVKVFSKLCVEHCLVETMMAGAGSNGMWG